MGVGQGVDPRGEGLRRRCAALDRGGLVEDVRCDRRRLLVSLQALDFVTPVRDIVGTVGAWTQSASCH